MKASWIVAPSPFALPIPAFNYKDALAATGAGKIIRRFPCVGGIDLCGTVIDSADARFKAGDQVIATSFDIGVAHHGGYAEIARVPGDWVVPLPPGLSLFESMALGTAGFTAALGIVRMEENRLRPENGPVIVTGSTGGVGSLAVDMLARLGYHVVALTGKESEADYLRSLGAREVMLRQNLDLTKIRPLDKGRWAGAVDNLGGDVLAWIASTMEQGGTIASIGLAASMSLNTTVAPFILRGVSLLGIDSGYIRNLIAAVSGSGWRQICARLTWHQWLAGLRLMICRPPSLNLLPEKLVAGLSSRSQEAEVANLPRILVVDDSKVVRASLAHHLKGIYDVREEENGESAWQTLVLDHSILAVISDLQMPKLDGFQLLERVRASRLRRLQQLPFILVSGEEGEEERLRASSLGVSDFIAKGAGRAEILLRLNHLLALSDARHHLKSRAKAWFRTRRAAFLLGSISNCKLPRRFPILPVTVSI